MKLGIVGLPNVGKSTLFNALTSTQNAQAANYPFCTIEPNSGIVPVPDPRLDKLAEIWQTDKKTPAIVEFVDIAGLVKGASQGAGLGNKFLGHIRECDAIVHVVRCFDDDNIIHVVEDVNKPESVDPIRDIDAIDLELILADLEVVSNRLGRQQKAAKTGNKAAAAEAAWLADLAGVRFSYSTNVDHLPFKGSKSLLTQMLLALVSNGVRAAGKGGEVEMKFHAENGRCVISVRDTGVGIPEDRMSHLFSGEATEEVPRPGEGAGLGLYNAQRIVALHGGVMVAQSSQDGGACLVVSLPIIVPTSVPARNNPGYDNLGGYSPILIELSDTLPWQAFLPKNIKHPH